MAGGKAAGAAGKNKSEHGIIVGKGKVTPIQVAFIVDRYLADNFYANTLATFRAEAADLFSKTKGKEVPKRLLGLAEMLDEYINLKEQRVMLDQEMRRLEMERQRVERVLREMQEVVHGYYSGGSASFPPSSPQFAAATASTTPPVPAFCPNGGAPPGQSVNGVSPTSFIQPPTMLPLKLTDPANFPASGHDSSTSKRRKTIKSSFDASLAPNKRHVQVHLGSSAGRVLRLSSQALTPEAETNLAATISATRGSLVTKSFSKQQSDYQARSSPKTPLKAENPADSPIENPSKSNDSDSLKEIAPVKCSIITSKTVIISPIKQTGYYSVEKSYQISSPYKSRREHARGKLDFDNSDGHMRLEEPVKASSSTSADGEIPGNFNFDLPDLDLFNGVSFSELLADIDLDCDLSSDPPTALSSTFVGHEHSEGRNGSVRTNQVLLDSSNPTSLQESSDDMRIKGLDSVTSVKNITKRIKFFNPVKHFKRANKDAVESSNSVVPTPVPDLKTQ